MDDICFLISGSLVSWLTPYKKFSFFRKVFSRIFIRLKVFKKPYKKWSKERKSLRTRDERSVFMTSSSKYHWLQRKDNNALLKRLKHFLTFRWLIFRKYTCNQKEIKYRFNFKYWLKCLRASTLWRLSCPLKLEINGLK